MRHRHHEVFLCLLAAGALLLAVFAHAARGSQDEESEDAHELTAKSRLLPSVRAGVETVRRDARGRYAVLAAPAQSIRFYAPDGKLLEEIPAGKTKHPLISDAADFDVDTQGSLYVADHGANAIKIFDATGNLRRTIPFQAPSSLAVLSTDEFAVVGLQGNHLVEIVSADGKLLREFGELDGMAEHAALNRYLNLGRLATDDAGNVYYAFSYMPEPSVRKFSRAGSAVFDVSLRTSSSSPRPWRYGARLPIRISAETTRHSRRSSARSAWIRGTSTSGWRWKRTPGTGCERRSSGHLSRDHGGRRDLAARFHCCGIARAAPCR